jgi:hypothetical protein
MMIKFINNANILTNMNNRGNKKLIQNHSQSLSMKWNPNLVHVKSQKTKLKEKERKINRIK